MASGRPAGGRIQVFVLIDALGWRIAEAHGFLDALLPCRRPLRTTLGYSSGAIPTMLSGLRPDEHGHWNLLYLDPSGSPFRWMRHLPGAWLSRMDGRWGRRALTELGRRVFALGPGFECAVRPELLPWFNWAEKRHLFQPGSLQPATSAFDLWRDVGLRYGIYSYRDGGGDMQLLRRARHDLERGRATTLFVYLSELDHMLHLHREEPAAISQALEEYAGALESLFRAAERCDPDMRFRIFSDHGMAPVRQRVDLATPLAQQGWRSPQDYLAVFDSTMLRFWFFHAQARAGITAWLAGLDCGRILDQAELRRQGVWFPDGRFGDLIFLLRPGVMVASGEFNGRGWNPCGMHGYDPDDPDSDAVLLSNYPGDARRHAIDEIFECLCEPLGEGWAA
ncbi:MAG: alkaline phosphatase family protein [Terriglobales bacterium]